jgi:hypothetical protein
MSLSATIEESRSLHFLYLVGEVEKGGWQIEGNHHRAGGLGRSAAPVCPRTACNLDRNL